MEEYFGFDISNEEAESIRTVDHAISIFYKHMNDQIANKLANPEQTEVKK